MEEVKYLYHYTSIESLALILKNKTIRFAPLDKMDDLQEQKTAEIRDFGKFTFVSCWTSDQEESIPMWNMYTPLTSGVRIKMKTRPFVQYNNVPVNQLRERAWKNGGGELDNIAPAVSYIDAEWMIHNGVITPHIFGDDILYEIEYTNNMQKLEPHVTTIKDGQIYLHGNALGKHKNDHWRFQKEWRYLLAVYPWAPLRERENPPPLQYVELEIEAHSFEDMEITCSPKLTPGNRVILESLIKMYNPRAIIKESELLGKI